MIIFGQVNIFNDFDARFGVKINNQQNGLLPNYNLRPGNTACLVTCDYPQKITNYHYGLTPFWSSDKITLYHAPVDGDVPFFPPKKDFQKRIDQMPSFRKPIKEQRCIIPADYFIVTENDTAYLFYLKNGQPFAIGGVYDHWKLTIKDEILSSGFCPVTLPQTHFFQIGITRFPLILENKNIKKWLSKDTPYNEIAHLMEPVNGQLLNGYQIDNSLLSKGVNNKRVMKQIGEYLHAEGQNGKGILTYLKAFRSKA